MIIGITGTFGAGKGTVVDFLKQTGFKHYSVRDFLTDEIKKRGLPVNRDSMVIVANQLREINSPSYIVEKLYEQAKQEEGNVIIESIRTPGEAYKIKEMGGYLIAVDADSKTRYSRIIIRQTETDNISYEEFINNEKREMFSTDPNKQNLSECIEMADYVIYNNKTFEELNKKIREVYQDILNKMDEKRFQPPKEIEMRKEAEKIKAIKEDIRPLWDEYFMKITSVVAERSTCLRHNVGAIIVKNKRILTTGYNGAVRGQEDCLKLGCRKDELNIESGFGSEECRAVHAEQNAIIQAALHGINTDSATLYCTTIPCRMCAKEIVNAGIKEVVTYSDYAGAKGSIEFLEQCGVKFKKIQRPKDEIKFKD